MLRDGSYLQERYEIIERIGSGGMSDVYKARDRKLNRLVGIKVLKNEFCGDHEFVRKFKMEAQAAAGLSHPNVVNVYDVVDEDDLHYIVMELVEGITLKDYIKLKGRLGVMEAVGVSIQIASGISAAHAQHIIHRDIKPQNVIISSDGKAKVADFGIARAATSDTLNSTAMGSVHYISPEQARGENSDERSDIYSLGISMYEMVTGRLPFNGDNSVAIALAHIEDEMPLASRENPEVTPQFDQIIQKCCQKKPERRYQNIDDVVFDLRSLLAPQDPVVDIVSTPEVGDTVILTEQEVAEINVRAKLNSENKKTQKDPIKKKTAPKKKKHDEFYDPDEDEHTGHFDKIVTVGGIILAIIIVIAVIFGIMKFSGIIGNSAMDLGNSLDVITGEKELVSDKQTYVPDVVGLNVELGENKLKDYNLGIDVTSYEYSNMVEKDSIISQSPMANELVDKYSTVSVVVSKGSTADTEENLQIDISDKLYLTQGDVQPYLEEKGFEVKTVEEYNDEYSAGVVIGIEPMVAEPGSVVTLTVSKGKNEDITTMPSIIGLTEEEAIGLLADAQLQPGTVTEEIDAVVPAGCIISQAIPAGTEISKGTAISYSLSKGPEDLQSYVASLRATYNLAETVGPGSAGMKLIIMVRLHQLVTDENGELVDQYTTLMEPRTVNGSTVLPLRFDYIEGAYGVDDGEVEVVNVETDPVLKSYPVEFFKQ